MTEDPVPYCASFPCQPDPKASLRRVFEAAGCRTQVELAEFLGVRQSSVSDAKKRGSVPAEWLLKLLFLRGINPIWVLTGQGARWMRPTEEAGRLPLALSDMEACAAKDCTTEALLHEVLRRVVQGKG